MGWEKTFLSHISNEGYLLHIYKEHQELSKLNYKTKNKNQKTT